MDVPVYRLGQQFKVYNFEGNLPDISELLVPHRKDHYLIVFAKKASNQIWIDMQPFRMKENTLCFYGPNQVIVKEEFEQLWSTGIAFTPEFLSLQGNTTFPLIQNPHNGFHLVLSEEDISVIEDLFGKISNEYKQPGEWQQRMLSAYLTLLLTYLSRLYEEQYKTVSSSADKLLLKHFQQKINESFRELHEVGDYATLLHISAGHLSEVVRSQSGKPAIKHIHERLIMEARRLLFHTGNTSKEIAFDLGFSDASYFNRFFKRETGATPAEYRSSIREMYH
jgi:AraC family transcriptional regulator, transcriptional activator of pobA